MDEGGGLQGDPRRAPGGAGFDADWGEVICDSKEVGWVEPLGAKPTFHAHLGKPGSANSGASRWVSLKAALPTLLACSRAMARSRHHAFGGAALMWNSPHPWPSGSRKLCVYMNPKSSALS